MMNWSQFFETTWLFIILAVQAVSSWSTSSVIIRPLRYPQSSPLRAATDSVADFATASPPAISVDGLSCSHDGGETYQVRDVSFVLPQGAKAALIGINGSGKVHAAKMISMYANPPKLQDL